jgi:hypothetical protein
MRAEVVARALSGGQPARTWMAHCPTTEADPPPWGMNSSDLDTPIANRVVTVIVREGQL